MVETVGEPAVQQVSLPCFPSAFLVPSGGLALTGSGCRIMADYKFKIGQTVLFRPKRQLTLTPLNGRPCRIIQILPAMNGERHYRIRSMQTTHEIMASESELRPVQDTPARRY